MDASEARTHHAVLEHEAEGKGGSGNGAPPTRKPPAYSTPLVNTLNARGKRYGVFEDNARIAQNLKDVVRTAGRWDEMSKDQREAVDMILSKISRLTTGDPDYRDNWHDIAGYAQLIEQRLPVGFNV